MAITVGSSTITVNSGAVMADPPGTAGLFFNRAWVKFTSTGTIVINGSGGVSSLTDNAVGDYTVNFSTAMTDTNYAGSVSINWETGNIHVAQFYITTTTYARVITGDAFRSGAYASTLLDIGSFVMVDIIR